MRRSRRIACQPICLPPHAVARCDGHHFFETLGDSIVTGPTLTNVNDFRAVLVTADAAQTAYQGK
jgi:hydroxypyruvate reductase